MSPANIETNPSQIKVRFRLKWQLNFSEWLLDLPNLSDTGLPQQAIPEAANDISYW